MRIYVKVLPRSTQNKIEKVAEGEYRVKLTALPIKGQANEALVKLLAKHFGVSKSSVVIVGGKTMSKKMVDVGEVGSS